MDDMHDSGERTTFDSGAVRDGARDRKPRPDLISPFFMMRLGRWMALGARKYSDRNWEKGMPQSGYLASLWRHLVKFMLGFDDEDHLAAAAFNVMALIHGEAMLARSTYPAELDDLPAYVDDADHPDLWDLPKEDDDDA